jgi:hypothetical protein
VAKRYRRTEQNSNSEVDFKSWPWQNVYLYGSRKSSPEFSVLVGKDPSQAFAQTYPNVDTRTVTTEGLSNVDRYKAIFTWHDSEYGSFGLPVIAAWSDAWFTLEDGGMLDVLKHHCAAGMMEQLRSPETLNVPWSGGTALEAFGLFMNNLTPDPKDYFSELKNWPGILQAVALPMGGLTKIKTRTTVRRNSDPNQTSADPGWSRTPVFENVNVDDPRNCLDLTDPETVTRINSGGALSLHGPTDGPSLGKMRGVRFCLLWNFSTSTATGVHMFARFGPTENYALLQESLKEYNLNKNVAYDDGLTDFQDSKYPTLDVPNMKLSGVTDRCFASFWLSPYFDPHVSIRDLFEHVDASDLRLTFYEGTPAEKRVSWKRTRKYPSEWKLTQWDRTRVARDEWAQFPCDVMIKSLGGVFDVIGCWLEVVYESKLNGSVPDPVIAKAERQVWEMWEADNRLSISLGQEPGMMRRARLLGMRTRSLSTRLMVPKRLSVTI